MHLKLQLVYSLSVCVLPCWTLLLFCVQIFVFRHSAGFTWLFTLHQLSRFLSLCVPSTLGFPSERKHTCIHYCPLVPASVMYAKGWEDHYSSSLLSKEWDGHLISYDRDCTLSGLIHSPAVPQVNHSDYNIHHRGYCGMLSYSLVLHVNS